jgi:undecaprenyl-diphosphatase
VNPFDLEILRFANGFAGESHTFDLVVAVVGDNNLIKGGVVVSILWWAWFRPDKNQDSNRTLILGTLLAGFVALLCARILQLTLPFRPRPLHSLAIEFQVPYGVDATALTEWSAFPSDHATLFFALATGLALISRAAGVAAFIHALAAICMPRIYLGLHYPSDIVAGALIGIGIAYLVNKNSKITYEINEFVKAKLRKSPGAFYACFFVLSYQLATLFEDARVLTAVTGTIVREIISGFLG